MTAQNLAAPVNFYTGVMFGVRDYVDSVHGSEQGYIREAIALARAISTRI